MAPMSSTVLQVFFLCFLDVLGSSTAPDAMLSRNKLLRKDASDELRDFESENEELKQLIAQLRQENARLHRKVSSCQQYMVAGSPATPPPSGM